MKRIFFITLIWQAFAFTAQAQNPVIDSLENLLQISTEQDTTRVNLLNETAFQLYSIDPEKTLQYAQEAGKLADKLNFKKGKAASLRNIGIIYHHQGNYPKALEYYQKSLQINEEMGDKKGKAASLGNIGIIYYNRGDYPKALGFHQKSLQINEEMGVKKGIAASLGNIGTIYYNQDDYPKALEYFQKSFQLFEETGNTWGTAANLSNIGDIYKKQGDYPKALEYYQKALKKNEQLDITYGICVDYISFGAVYLETNEYAQALTYSLKALKIAQELGLLDELKEINEQLSKIYAATNNYQKAYKYHLAFKQLSDSLFNEENVKKITGLEYEYKYEKEKQATALEQAKKDALQAEEAKQERIIRNAFIAGFVLVLLLALVILRSLVQKRKSNRQLAEQKQVIKETNTELKQTNEELNTTLSLVNEQKTEIEKQKAVVEDAHKQITDSINYASRIQNAILPLQSTFDTLLPSHFILFKPRDTVSGDFYYVQREHDKTILAAVDCTGHGVPGAFMSMVGNDLLNTIIKDKQIIQADKMLTELHEGVRSALQQEETQNRDGMDMALVVIDEDKKTLEFAGAKNPLIYIQNSELKVIKGDRVAVGGKQKEAERTFTAHQIDISQPTTFYLFSDGYQDQFGGPEGRKFMTKRFRNLLLEIHQKPMEEQSEVLDQTIQDWMKEGNEKQVDDILVVGVKV